MRVSPATILTVREGKAARFTCEGNGGPMVLQLNHNVSFAPAIVKKRSNGSTDYTLYQIDDIHRSDNGTTIQCFSNAQDLIL